MGTTPPVDRQMDGRTDACQNITFPSYYYRETNFPQCPGFFTVKEQSLEGIICWLVDTFVVYCIHVKHTFEDYITQQTYVQQCNAQSAVLLNCGLHLD